MGPYQILPLRVRVDPGVMAVKGYATRPKAQEEEDLPICRGAVGVFYNPSQQPFIEMRQTEVEKCFLGCHVALCDPK